MKWLALAFSAGVLALHVLAPLPLTIICLVFGVAVLALLGSGQARGAGVLGAAAFGMLWAWSDASDYRAAIGGMPAAGETVTVNARLTELAHSGANAERLVFRLTEPSQPAVLETGSHISVWWTGDDRPLPGETWRFSARLRRPIPPASPGAFDEAAWLYREDVVATGNVRARSMRRLAPQPTLALAAIRHELSRRLSDALTGHPMSGVIRALAVGDRAGIGDDQWRVFRATGTSHLVAISGLHIGLAAGWFGALAGLLARLQGRGSVRISLIAGLAAAAGYAALAGFSVPTQRALVMLGFGAGAVLLARQTRGGGALIIALAAVLLWFPRSVLAPGLWLSFAAVAWILYALLGQGRDAFRVASLVRLQLAVALGLMPLTLIWFSTASWVAPLVNLLAVPFFALLVVPLTLAGMVALAGGVDGIALLALRSAAEALEWVWPYLAWLADQPLSAFRHRGLSLPAAAMALAGVALLTAPRGWPGRWLGLPIIAGALSIPANLWQPSEVRLWGLDAGAATTVLMTGGGRAVLFGAGGPGRGRDGAERVIIPALVAGGVHRIDDLVIADARPALTGGLRTLLRDMSPERLWMGGEPLERIPGALPCSGFVPVPLGTGITLQLDGVGSDCRLSLRAGDSVVTLTPDGPIFSNGGRMQPPFVAEFVNGRLSVKPWRPRRRVWHADDGFGG